ncbi:isoaspartyl peptidase/L-asparaginase family protein [Lichenihabitans psoromatis]|uniref:isoaspartyl peptidase/L-asparaginase family protein n=1 Tax=Lichenihabitans psoromatis TaxID=2528642 RepID=UPI001035C676|nr:isoaspartyl peptidase/L-asparaginase [Lichenihabitans psoromatis]
MNQSVLAIHGGCGVLAREDLSDAEWREARQHLTEALRAGWAVLTRGGRAVDAVEAAVVVMEDSPHFNAGHGAALNHDGLHELDASIMDGATLAAGAIVAAQRIRNPVKAARAVLESGTLAMLTGPSADLYAEAHGVELVDQSYFTTERRRDALASMIRRGQDGTLASASEAEKHGTVGAVALDRHGHLAAATSTGGYTNKPAGRVGDSPIIGAGTYARDGVCAVSGTGQGEYFIRHVLGHEIASRIAYLGESLATATDTVLADLAPYRIGAGLVSVDATGHVAAPFNTGGMFRGWVMANGDASVGIHAEIAPVGNFGS